MSPDRGATGNLAVEGANSYTLEVTLAVIYRASGDREARQIAGRVDLLIKQ